VLYSPLSASSLSKLLHLLEEEVDQTFENLHAILDISKDSTRLLCLLNPLFRDFLLNKDRSGEFWVNEKEIYKIMATRYVGLLSQILKEDI
jgi:hypothetical protein